MLSLEQQAPKWLLRVATPGGVADFECRHGLQLPETLQEYYRSLRLISLLQAAWDVLNMDLFLADLPDEDQPHVRTWRGRPYVVIGEFPHTGTVCGAELTGDDQHMYWEGVFLDRQPSITLPDWIHGVTMRLLGDDES